MSGGGTRAALGPRNGWRRRWRRLTRRTPGLAVWLLAVLLAALLLARRERGLQITGYAEAGTTSVAAAGTGRLAEVAVVPHQPVRAGQVVAWLEDAALQLELEAARGELLRLRAEGERADALQVLADGDRDLERRVDHRRLARDVENRHLEWLESRAELAAAHVQLLGLEAHLARTRHLYAQELTSAAVLEVDSVAAATQRVLVGGLDQHVAEMELALQSARERLRSYLAAGGELPDAGPDGVFAAALEIQDVRIAQAELALARCALRAPIAGAIGAILRRPGEVVLPGDAVATVVPPGTDTIVAYVPEGRLRRIEVGAEVGLRRAGAGGERLLAEVVSIGPAVERLPARLDPAPAVPRWGQPVRLRLVGAEVRGGEVFTVSF